jgi:hypothetical protein
MGVKPSRASATSPGSRLPSVIGLCNARDAPQWLLQARSQRTAANDSVAQDRWDENIFYGVARLLMRIQIDDVKLFFDVEGSKLRPNGQAMQQMPTLLLLHGGPWLRPFRV